MKFQSQIITAGSGSIGGTTYAHNKGGMYMRGRGTPTNPNSTRQQATRTQFGTYASRWTSHLDQAQRDSWNAYAQTHTVKGPFGEDVYINGISWYIMFNTRIVDAGIPPVDNPPVVPTPDALTTFDCAISAATTVDVTFTPVIIGSQCLQLWMTLPGSHGQTPNFKQARLVGYSPLGQASPWAATMPFGAQVNEQCTFYCKVLRMDGPISTAVQDTVIAAY
ncbi:hypothetical protein ES703_80005 [subsurface metagenome]